MFFTDARRLPVHFKCTKRIWRGTAALIGYTFTDWSGRRKSLLDFTCAAYVSRYCRDAGNTVGSRRENENEIRLRRHYSTLQYIISFESFRSLPRDRSACPAEQTRSRPGDGTRLDETTCERFMFGVFNNATPQSICGGRSQMGYHGYRPALRPGEFGQNDLHVLRITGSVQ